MELVAHCLLCFGYNLLLIDNFTISKLILIKIFITSTSRPEYTEQTDVHRKWCKKHDLTQSKEGWV